MTLRVLFVDDEPNVLQGLQRMLRSMREEWDMDFASGGSEALEKFRTAPYDVVVSDMRMPGMSGAELLIELARLHPRTIRLILSGHADEAMILRTVGPAHQFLAKPCHPEILKAAVRRAAALRNLLGEERLRTAAAGLRSLPSLPDLYAKVVAEVQSPNGNVKSVAALIGRDVSMSARILQLVNSAFFGLKRRVKGVEEAVSLLGLGTMQRLVLAGGAFEAFDPSRFGNLSIDRIWLHSLLTSRLAGRIAREERADEEFHADVVTAALLHEVGVLVLASRDAAVYADLERRAREAGGSLEDSEQEAFGCRHGEAGAFLLGLWGLGDPVVEGVAYHHRPEACVNRSWSPLTVVHAADAIAEEFESGAGESRVCESYLAATGKTGRLDAWRHLCSEIMSEEGGS